jgi:sugar (pentulose or hexulose) kinase
MIVVQRPPATEYLRDKILYHNDELLKEEQAPDVFQIFDRIAAKVPPGSNGLMYMPWIYGERAPIDDRNARAALFNISLENTREDIVRAFLEGVALNTRWLWSRRRLWAETDAAELPAAGQNRTSGADPADVMT